MRPAAAGLLAALLMAACHPPASDDKVFGERVRAYLLAHPEVLSEASAKYAAGQEARDAEARRQAEARLPALRAAIERDPRDFVANPMGKITITEFYDYQCPHCINIAPQLLDLVKKRPEVRLVFKEMPFFGSISEHAAYAALAVKKAGGDYLGYYQTLMATHPLDDAAIDRAALARGARASDIAPSASATAQLAATSALFDKLDMGGTPGFVIGDKILATDDPTAIASALETAARRS
jgi:protein-disulfide isomerase